jgi:DNA transformation protein
MAVSAETRAWVMELFDDLGNVSARAMMGGLALYESGTIFGIVGPGDRVYLKARGALADELAAQGSEPFTYARKDGKAVSMGYWSLPDAALDEPEAACDWARRARAADGGFS